MRNPLPLADAVVFSTTGNEDTLEGAIQPTWGQGRAAFGGLLLGVLARAGDACAPSDRRLRSINMSFLAPANDGPFSVTTEHLREGRSVSHIQARFIQENRVRAVADLAYGTARPGSLHLDAPAIPEATAPADAIEMPYVPGQIPEFTQHFDYRWTNSNFPYSGTGDTHVQGWIRPRIAAPLDTSLVLALADSFPPPILARAQRVAPASSLSAHIQLPGLMLPQDTPHPWFFFDGSATYADDGYSNMNACLWHQNGTLVATATQLFADFSGPA